MWIRLLTVVRVWTIDSARHHVEEPLDLLRRPRPLLTSWSRNGLRSSSRIAGDESEALCVSQRPPEHDVAVADGLRCQRSPTGASVLQQRGVQALDLERCERLELHCADLAGDALDGHPVTHPRRLPDPRLDGLQPVIEELRQRDTTPGHRRRPRVGSGREISQRGLSRLLRREARAAGRRRRPVAGSGPRSTTNDHTFPFRCTEPLAMDATVERGCHGP